MPKLANGERMFLRRRLLKGSDWTSTIPSAYEISFLNSTCEPHAETVIASIERFNRYVEDQRRPRGRRGCTSLRDMAIELLLKNLSNVDNLDHLPKHLTKSIWHTVKRRCMLSFHGWKILSKALYREEDVSFGMFQYCKSIQCPKYPLFVYIKPLISTTFDFIASLTINIYCTVVDLVQLAKISNLGILEIVNPNTKGDIASGVGDVVLRTWSREAEENGAFSVLRILKLWHHHDLTEKSLQHIHSFPALAIFDLRDCGMNDCGKLAREAEKIGWSTIVDTDLLRILEEKYKENQKMMFASSGSVPRQTERGPENAPWPGLRVRRIEKSDVHSFLARVVEDEVSGYTDHVKDGADGDKKWASMSWDIFCKTGYEKSWESDLAVRWALIGELRDDHDLKAAGIGGIEKTFVGQQVVSPVPMAYIRLVDVHQSRKRVMEDTSIIFFLKSMDQPTPSKRDSQSRLESSWLGNRSTGKRSGGGLGKLRPLKKQKLDDILHGFTPS